MRVYAYVLIAILWAASVAAAAAFASPQAPEFRPVREPRILSGPDIGFRVTGMYGDVPAGTLMIRVNGAWVEAHLGGGVITIR